MAPPFQETTVAAPQRPILRIRVNDVRGRSCERKVASKVGNATPRDNARDQRTYGDVVLLPREFFGKLGGASGNSGGGGPSNQADPSVTHTNFDVARHRGGAE